MEESEVSAEEVGMLVNWPERFFCNSFIRRFVQRRQARQWRAIRPMPPGGDMLEIGCGNGAGARIIMTLFTPQKFTALDPDPAMLALARKRLAQSIAEVAEGNAEDLPFESARFDAVFNFGILHHVEGWPKAIAEVARVLRPGGAFYIEEIFPDLYAGAVLRHIVAHPAQGRFYPLEFKESLREAGLDLLPGYRQSRLTMLGVAVKRASA